MCYLRKLSLSANDCEKKRRYKMLENLNGNFYKAEDTAVWKMKKKVVWKMLL